MTVKPSLCHEPDSRAGGEATYLGVSRGKAAKIVEEGMATHSSILAWRSPWTEEPGRLRSIESQRVGTQLKQLHTHTRTWSALPGSSQSPLGSKSPDLDTTISWSPATYLTVLYSAPGWGPSTPNTSLYLHSLSCPPGSPSLTWERNETRHTSQ